MVQGLSAWEIIGIFLPWFLLWRWSSLGLSFFPDESSESAINLCCVVVIWWRRACLWLAQSLTLAGQMRILFT